LLISFIRYKFYCLKCGQVFCAVIDLFGWVMEDNHDETTD
jgi:hypothetical protein